MPIISGYIVHIFFIFYTKICSIFTNSYFGSCDVTACFFLVPNISEYSSLARKQQVVFRYIIRTLSCIDRTCYVRLLLVHTNQTSRLQTTLLSFWMCTRINYHCTLNLNNVGTSSSVRAETSQQWGNYCCIPMLPNAGAECYT